MRALPAAALAAATLIALVAATPAFTQTPPAPAAATAPRQALTVRGLMRDKPFTLAYPAQLSQRNDGNADLVLADAAQEFEASLTIRAATPSLSAAFDARAFGDGSGFLQMLQRSVPGARLIGNGMITMPAGQAHAVHWAAPANGPTPAMRYIDLTVYDGGRGYLLSFAVREGALERRRDTIGYILANFTTTGTAAVCCASPVAVP